MNDPHELTEEESNQILEEFKVSPMRLLNDSNMDLPSNPVLSITNKEEFEKLYSQTPTPNQAPNE